jgi:hypothetical protein
MSTLPTGFAQLTGHEGGDAHLTSPPSMKAPDEQDSAGPAAVGAHHGRAQQQAA